MGSNQKPRGSAGVVDGQPWDAPSAGLWCLINALISCIDMPRSRLDVTLGLPPQSVVCFRRMEHLSYLAYWEWCIGAANPDRITLHTPVGSYAVDLASRDTEAIESQVRRRLICALGAGCSLEGAKSSIENSRRQAVERFAAPLSAGHRQFTDPIDIITDLIATQGVEPNNLTMATGASIAFIDHCIARSHGSTTGAMRRLWSMASVLGCSLDICYEARRYELAASQMPSSAAVAALMAGYAHRSRRPHLVNADLAELVAGVESGQETLASMAKPRGVTPQRIQAVLTTSGYGVRGIKTEQERAKARQYLVQKRQRTG